VQFHDAYTVCQAHFPQPLATICENKQIARAIADQRKLKSMSQNQDEYKKYELLLAYTQLFPYATIVHLVQKLRPNGKMSDVPLINASNRFFDHDPQSRDDSRFVRLISREHAIFHIQCRHAMGHEEYSTATCTTRVLTDSPTKCSASANESRGCGQKSPQRMLTYEHHRIVEVKHKGLARQVLKLVKALETLELQEWFLDDDLH